ncbi:MAG: O-methyltransferase [Lachnospiraceae bacterium]|nr:O-methyltransferase [Lachnospiraceae bacterium]
MVGNERLTGFVNSLYKGNTPFLEALEREAREDDIPVIRKDTQAFLRFLLKEHDPGSILEIGAAVGFSAIFMAEYSSPECRIRTIENYEKRIAPARQNIERSGYSHKIRLICKDAAEILPALQEGFDMIFIDAAKAQYPFYLKEADRLINPGGLIIADNCLQEGDILESKFAVERRNRTIHKRMREFLKEITASERYTAAVLPIGDGIAVAVKDK